ncbi:Ankyrin repeat-containing protein [Tieghemostelium lacteum]|uniref:Palmitoyltransferase n=1 Tax=Tieghemostelium lacteum TaxID=361077 RepID=A0A151Z7G7_TIELA|nr:Ankyrin repeat-containing protein [Tieghemostelium lacteum]|eukprot:KYQ89878.1 Ankyrin repeat-containing protein [Tieghemostelium lacteum]
MTNSTITPTTLIDIVKSGNLKECIGFIERIRLNSDIGDIINQVDDQGNTALHFACYKKSFDIVKYLLSNGADPNIGNLEERATPLHWACIGGNSYIVKYLITNGGADTQQKDIRGYNSLIHSVQHGELNVVRYLLEKPELSLDINSRDTSLKTPLIWASCQGHHQLILYLLHKGANINSVDIQGRSAIHWSIVKSNVECTRILIEMGANLTIQDKNKQTPLSLYKENPKLPKEYLTLFNYNPLKYLTPLLYNTFWILLSIILFFTYGGLFFIGPIYVSLILFGCLSVALKIFLENYVILNLPNPFLATLMISTFSYWLVYYLRFIIPLYPEIVMVHTSVVFLFIVNYYLIVKLIFSDAGQISPSNKSQDSIDFIQAIDRESLDIPETCSSCLINKPIRTKHCRTCNKCIARFDHHCAWINNCVGINNNQLFIYQLLLTCLLFIITIIFNLKYFNNNRNDSLEIPVWSSEFISWIQYQYQNNKALFIYFNFEIIVMVWVLKLLYTQIYGIIFNITMFEIMRQKITKRLVNPYDRGVKENIREFFFEKSKKYYYYSVSSLKRQQQQQQQQLQHTPSSSQEQV